MRLFHIMFNDESENILPNGYILGNEGEENATELIINPPAEMLIDEISYFRIAFELSNCRSFHSDRIPYDYEVRYLLPAEVTSSETVAIQLEGYNDAGDMIIKSPKITKLKFNPSVCGTEVSFGNAHGIGAEVALNTAFREKFSEDENGNLTYKGNSIGSGEAEGSDGAVKKTIPLDVSNVIVESASNDNIHQYFRIAMYQNPLPVNAVITNMRIKTSNSDLVDIKDIQKYTGAPIVINMNRIFYDEINATYIIAIIYTFGIANPIIDDMIGFLTELIEIDYYE